MNFYLYIDNIICIFVITVLLMSVTMQKSKSDKSTVRFVVLAHTELGFLITDLLCDMVEGKPDFRLLSYIVNTLGFLWIDVMIVAFSAYLAILIRRVSAKWAQVMNPAVFFTYLRIIVVLVLAIPGKLFTIDENGVYQEEALTNIPYIMMGLVLVLLMIVVFCNKPYFNTQQFSVIIIYLTMPLIGALIEMFSGYYVFTTMSTTLSVLLIYTMVQSGIIEEYRIRESLLEEMSTTDLLTKMNNRRAYYNRFAKLLPQENVGVIFCDINGLKYTNDTYGHAAGDKLIQNFAGMLSSIFDPKDIFRISGDEFVLVIPGIPQNTFSKKYEDLKKLVGENNTIAALGSAYGTGCCIEHLVSLAEGLMYEDKRDYHSRFNTGRGEAIPVSAGTPAEESGV